MNTKGYKETIEDAIEAMAAGAVFVPSDFSAVADTQYIRRVFKTLADEGRISRVLPGVFYLPKTNRLLKETVPPDPDDVAHAIARAQNWTIAPCGQTALNALGLSTQVPAVWTYTSDGSYRDYSFDGFEISFRRSTNKDVKNMSPTTLLVVQACKALGKERVTDEVMAAIAKRLSSEDRETLMEETGRATAWIREAVRAIYKMGEGA